MKKIDDLVKNGIEMALVVLMLWPKMTSEEKAEVSLQACYKALWKAQNNNEFGADLVSSLKTEISKRHHTTEDWYWVWYNSSDNIEIEESLNCLLQGELTVKMYVNLFDYYYNNQQKKILIWSKAKKEHLSFTELLSIANNLSKRYESGYKKSVNGCLGFPGYYEYLIDIAKTYDEIYNAVFNQYGFPAELWGYGLNKLLSYALAKNLSRKYFIDITKLSHERKCYQLECMALAEVLKTCDSTEDALYLYNALYSNQKEKMLEIARSFAKNINNWLNIYDETHNPKDFLKAKELAESFEDYKKLMDAYDAGSHMHWYRLKGYTDELVEIYEKLKELAPNDFEVWAYIRRIWSSHRKELARDDNAYLIRKIARLAKTYKNWDLLYNNSEYEWRWKIHESLFTEEELKEFNSLVVATTHTFEKYEEVENIFGRMRHPYKANVFGDLKKVSKTVEQKEKTLLYAISYFDQEISECWQALKKDLKTFADWQKCLHYLTIERYTPSIELVMSHANLIILEIWTTLIKKAETLAEKQWLYNNCKLPEVRNQVTQLMQEAF